jgi:hypothetical protein
MSLMRDKDWIRALTLDEFDERQEKLACQRCGLDPLELYEIHGGEYDGRLVVVCEACRGLLELLQRETGELD